MDLSNCITDDITTCNNDNMAISKSAYFCFNDFPLFLIPLLIFINTQIMQISYCAYLDHGMKQIWYQL